MSNLQKDVTKKGICKRFTGIFTRVRQLKSINPGNMIRCLILLFLSFVLVRNTYDILTGSTLFKLYELQKVNEVKETSLKGKDVLKVGVHNDIAGLGLYNKESNKYYGLEIDIAKEIAERMGYRKIHFDPVNVSTRNDVLYDKKVDLVIASCTLTSTPPTGLIFSVPYIKTHGSLLAVDSTYFKKVSDLDGKTIGVKSDSANMEQTKRYLGERKIDATYQEYDDYDKLFQAMYEGEVDAISIDESLISTYEDTEYNNYYYSINMDYIEFDYAALMRDDSPMISEINKSIYEMQKDGTLDAIKKKWEE